MVLAPGEYHKLHKMLNRSELKRTAARKTTNRPMINPDQDNFSNSGSAKNTDWYKTKTIINQKCVCLLSPDHDNMVAPSSKTDKDGNDILKHTYVLDYDRSMVGVDMMGDAAGYEKSLQKAQQIFFIILLQCILSAHRVCKLRGGTQDFLMFLQHLVRQLLTFSPEQNPTATP